MKDYTIMGCQRDNIVIPKCYTDEYQKSAKMIKELRESINMSRREFSTHIGIPVRTLEDWEAGRRTPPEYVPRLIAYQLKYEELVRKLSCEIDSDGHMAGEGTHERL